MRLWILLTLLILSTYSFSQIRITDVGDGWKGKVEQALDTIQKYDKEKYYLIMETCKVVAYWNGGFATTESDSIITIPTKEMNDGNIYNIAAILVHESLHLYFITTKFNLRPHVEEVIAYQHELEFLYKIPCVDEWLIQNAKNKIIFYSKP
jgi:hypothetical protein